MLQLVGGVQRNHHRCVCFVECLLFNYVFLLAHLSVPMSLHMATTHNTTTYTTTTGNDAQSAMVDCKASSGNIITPPDTDAVAHGDANLAIDDFLSRAL